MYSEGAVSETQALWHREQHRMHRFLGSVGGEGTKNPRLGTMWWDTIGYNWWERVMKGALEMGSW